MKNKTLSHQGATSWMNQRISAIALIPLVFYFAYLMLNIAFFPDIETICAYFESPFVTIFVTIFIIVGIYHGQLGIKEIIEDYVHCSSLKFTLVLTVKFLSFVTAIAAVCALLSLHISNFNFS